MSGDNFYKYDCKNAGLAQSIPARACAILNRDFCPWANQYICWLKEPVGWFLVATAVSILVGIFLSPMGWTLAAGLSAILILGLGFPWLATRTVICDLRPIHDELHEGDASHLELQVQNRLPIPISGLMIEGFLSQPLGNNQFDTGDLQVPDVGLARVPPLSRATYRLPICPQYRGRYPVQIPKIACSFPFGIWTARRALHNVQPVIVRPMLIPISASVEFAGTHLAEVGTGQRATTQGDFLGVRDFRRGDSLKTIHWVQSARQDELIVCERGGPQQQALELHLFTHRCQGSAAEARENLAWRVRIAASLIDLLVARHLSFHLFVDGFRLAIPEGAAGGRRAWELLAEIPLDTDVQQASLSAAILSTKLTASRIVVAGSDLQGDPLADHSVLVSVQHPSRSIRFVGESQFRFVDLDADISHQLNDLLLEVARDCQAA